MQHGRPSLGLLSLNTWAAGEVNVKIRDAQSAEAKLKKTRINKLK